MTTEPLSDARFGERFMALRTALDESPAPSRPPSATTVDEPVEGAQPLPENLA